MRKRIWNSFCIFLFSVLWTWVAFVSSVDTYLTVHLKETMPQFEQNPLARFIMHANQWNVACFIGIKMFATILVLGLLAMLYSVARKYTFMICFGMAFCQTLLLIYLLFG